MATKKKMLQAAAGNAGGGAGGPFEGATVADFTGGDPSQSVLIVNPGMMPSRSTNSPWCVEFYYNLQSTPSTDSPFAFNTSSGGNVMTVLFGYSVGIAAIGTVSLSLETVADDTGSLTLNQWRHFVLSYDGSYARYWIDGSYKGAFATSSPDFSSDYLLIGNEADSAIQGSGNLFPGYIADFRVWDINAYPSGPSTFTPPTSLTNHPYQNMSSSNLRFHLDGKTDISGNNITVTDFAGDITTFTSSSGPVAPPPPAVIGPRVTSLVHGLQSYNIASPTGYGSSYGGSYSTKFNDDGTRFWNVSANPSNGNSLPSVHQYELATAYDPTSYTSVVSYVTNWSDSYPVTSIDFSRDGAYMFAFSYGTSAVYRIALANPFDITSAPVSDQNTSFSHAGGGLAGAGWILSDGSAFITTQRTKDAWIFPLSTAYDLSTAPSTPTRVDLSSYMTHTPYGGTFFTDGQGDHYWMVGTRGSNYVYSFQLGTSEDLTTIQSVTSRDFGVASYDAQLTTNDLIFLGTGNSTAGNFYKFVR